MGYLLKNKDFFKSYCSDRSDWKFGFVWSIDGELTVEMVAEEN